MSEDVKGIKKWQAECLDKVGYYIHMVPDAYDNDKLINAHTHGFEITRGTLNFELVINLPEKVIYSVFRVIYQMVGNGVVFEEGIDYYDIIKDYPVRFIKTRNMIDDQDVYRVIFPDVNGLFPDDENCNELYKQQMII